MKLEQIEEVTDLSRLSRVDLFNLLGRVEQLHRRLRAERKRRQTESKRKTGIKTDHGTVGVEKPGLTGTWPIMQFENGQRVSIKWFIGTLKDAYVERNRLMANGGDFKVGIRKENFSSYKYDHRRRPDAISGQQPHIAEIV
jgi:hypothetical protein